MKALIKVLKLESYSPEKLQEILPARQVEDSSLEKSVREVLDDVKKYGDRALIKYAQKFDQVDLTKIGFSVSQQEIDESLKKVSKEFMKAVDVARQRIEAFHRQELEHSWFFFDQFDNLLGQIVQPINRVGVYVPGRLAAYPSTVLMNIVPAQVAGVKEIAVCVPPNKNGQVSKHVLAVLKKLKVSEVYRLGGAQAIAAFAFGTESVMKVDKIVGPGNIYVTMAKKLVFGQVGIDMLAGPSEIVVIADKFANPTYIAADLLAQAEHDPQAVSILITDSNKVIQATLKMLNQLLDRLSKNEIIEQALSNSLIIQVPDLDLAVEITNDIAPEHLELILKKAPDWLKKIKNTGAIFLGSLTPVVAGDYLAGPSHTLPTGGTAKFSSPLSVKTFLKHSSLISFSQQGIKELSFNIKVLAELEGLDAHALAVKVREEES
jgi:histidinol dehydrogenase